MSPQDAMIAALMSTVDNAKNTRKMKRRKTKGKRKMEKIKRKITRRRRTPSKGLGN